MVYTVAQLEQAWVRNGGNPRAAQLAAAISGAESKRNAEPEGDIGLGGSGPTSFGPYQVHTPAHPEYSPELLVNNLDYATKAAIKISNNGTDWTPWTTYKTGAYKAYLPSGSQANAGLFLEVNPLHIPSPFNPLKIPNPVGAGEAIVEGVEGVGGVGGALNSVGAAAGVLSTIGEWLSDPLRIVKLVGGGIITIMGLHTLTHGSVGGTVVRETRAAPAKAAAAAAAAAKVAA